MPTLDNNRPKRTAFIRRFAAPAVVALGFAACRFAETDFAQPILAQEVSQDDSASSSPSSDGAWRNADSTFKTDDAQANAAANEAPNPSNFTGPKTTNSKIDPGALPKDAGQFWVEYDLTPYTSRFPNVEEPQTAIVDWIAFDAGADFWQNEPFAAFSASSKSLRVYHNANVQQYLANVLDRFIDPKKQDASFSIKVVAVQSPDWRVRVASLLEPAPVKIVGAGVDAQGWLVENANVAKVVGEIEKRSDYILLNSVKNVVPNGEKFGWATQAPKRQYVKDVRVDASAVGGYVEEPGTVDEGFRIEATPLLSTNGEALEVLFRYNATVVEKTKTFSLRVPTSTAPRQQLEVERPAIVSCDVKGKIGTLRSKAAIVDLGLVPMTPPNKNERAGVVAAITKFVAPQSAFYDVIFIIEENK